MSHDSTHSRTRLLARACVPVVALMGTALTAGSAVAVPVSQQSLAATVLATTTTTKTVTLTPVADTYVKTTTPTRTYGRGSTLVATSAENRTFLKFDTGRAVADNQRVTAARLEVYVANADSRSRGLRAHAASSSWTEDGLRASTRPAFNTKTLSAAVPVSAAAHWQQVPISVPSAISTTAVTSLELLNPTAYSVVQMSSRESTRAPRLVLTVASAVASATTAPSPTATTTTAPTTTTTTAPTTATTTSPTTATTTAPTTATTAPSTTTTTSAVTAATTPQLPFDLPVQSTLQSTGRLAFAHYFTPYPVSIENADPATDYYTRNYLSPTGENGIHAAYGGLLRDRPIGRPKLALTDWAAQDFDTEVRQAKAAGLDGFTVDILSLSGYNYDRVVKLLQAANRVDPSFKIMLMPDMTSLHDDDPALVASKVAALAKYPAAFDLPDGRLVLSPFKAEQFSVSWWTTWLANLKSTHGVSVAFVPCFLNWTNITAFAPISYGFSAWGERTAAAATSLTTPANQAHSLGKIWMAPVAVQDSRPNQGIFTEAGNTDTLRSSWNVATNAQADWVQIPTWNDYSENTAIAPSTNHGWSFLDVSAYYLTKWKLGQTLPVVRDGMYLSHRAHAVAARPTFAETKLMTVRTGSTTPRDTVEVLAFFKAATTVTVKVGAATYTWDAPAGVSVKTWPLGTGTVSATAARGGVTVSAVTSPKAVTSAPYVQDLEYFASSSLR
jgi:hypothetical protein